MRNITVVGAGILGLWQALTLARGGHRVKLIERSAAPFADAQSRHAGAMLAPYCEGEAAPAVVREAGIAGLAIWRKTYPMLVDAGTLVVAQTRDLGELKRFARMAPGHKEIDAAEICMLEPDLGSRYASGLYFHDEAHLATPDAPARLLALAQAAGASIELDRSWTPEESADGADLVIDCRGLGARADLQHLRGVRGERIVVRARDVSLNRPVRLLHPRYPLYIVPWGNGVHLVGATVIESEDDSAVTVRSALELLGMAYALSPAFGEAEILEVSAGVRPAYPDNVPRAIVRGRRILVNGAYRHGFLLAPVLAAAVLEYVSTGASTSPLLQVESA